MAAGDRAAEQSRLAAERAARLRRELERAERNARAWSDGAAGEALVAKTLIEVEPYGWLALHDVHWPGRPKANLDHILVGPGGILVVDAKNWSGDVRLSSGVLRQNGYRRDSEVAGVLQQGAALTALLEPRHRRFVQGWLCLVAQPHIEGTAPNGVRIQGLATLTFAILGLPPVLDAAEIRIIHDYLREQLTGWTSPLVPSAAAATDADAAAASVAKWRAHQGVGSSPGIQQQPRWQPRKQRKRPSCLTVLLQLTLLFVGTFMLTSYALNQRPAVPVTPKPLPAVSQTTPAR